MWGLDRENRRKSLIECLRKLRTRFNAVGQMSDSATGCQGLAYCKNLQY
jgi:hypothetical protein